MKYPAPGSAKVWFALTAALVFLPASMAQTPEWIWHGSNAAHAASQETRYFRRQFVLPFDPQQGTLIAAGDDEITVFINGAEAARSTLWKTPAITDVTQHLRRGSNIIAAVARNAGAGQAGMLVKLEVRSPNMSGFFIVSDGSWSSRATPEPDWKNAGGSEGWARAVSLGKHGMQPWGDILQAPQATAAESLVLPPGFKAELLRSAQRDEGSWIAMCADGKGRLIISPEKTETPLLRVTLTPSGQFEKIERLASPLRAAMGLCWAYESLYVNGRGPKGVGLYRLIDKNHNDQFDPGEETLLKEFDGDNEHGYHAVTLGPDGAIYVLNGNHTKVPAGLAPDSPHKNYAEDLLLPRQWDANGHAKGVLAPGGYILKTDKDGREWRMICGGFRNAYDFDFAPSGEIFTFDSDMEWDVGAPWYRPTRILHCVTGGEYGWRSGTGKWPVYYPDSLPSAVDIGLSSPTAVRFGTSSRFPEKYRRALFAADWAYGKIFAVHIEPAGASYGATFETFVSGKPLAVTAIAFGQDGAMYFTIGGWKIQSGLYRVSYSGPAEAAKHEVAALTEAQQTRRTLESFHGHPAPNALTVAWPHLRSSDRWLRFAARIAIESQPVTEWRDQALAESDLNGGLTALLALARCGTTSDLPALTQRCLALLGQAPDEARRLNALRVLQVAFTRLGKPPGAPDVIERLSRLYPATSDDINRELCQLLVYLDAPDVLPKTLALMASAGSQEQQMHYAFVLRNVTHGWSAEQRRVYFAWFQTALAEYKGGASFRPYLINIRKEALANLEPSERAEVAALLVDRPQPTWKPQPRQIVKEWSLPDLDAALKKTTGKRSFSRGRQAFIDAQCVLCHRVGGDGGAVGPELTGVSGRFNRHDLIENILFPSKIISDRYQSFTISTRDGEEFSGCVTEETDDQLVVIVNPLSNQRATVNKKEIASRQVSKLSAMPEGLLNVLTEDDILDLIAFLEADGKSTAAVFARAK